MKTAVLFYSLDGNSAFIAEEIKTRLNADIFRVYTKDEKKRSKAGNIFWGGCMVFFGKKPPLKPLAFDPSAYDLIIIGAPVWADTPATPIKTFISSAGITGKKIALFVCHEGGMKKTLGKFKKLLPCNEIIAEIDFKNTLKNIDETKKKIEEWVLNLK